MTDERMIEILEDEIRHSKGHLRQEGMCEEFYKELGEWVETLETSVILIKSKGTEIAQSTPITEGDAISRSELQERREADNDLIKAFELLKAHCKNRECNKDCIFFRELAIGENKDQYCALCEIVTSDDKENEE